MGIIVADLNNVRGRGSANGREAIVNNEKKVSAPVPCFYAMGRGNASFLFGIMCRSGADAGQKSYQHQVLSSHPQAKSLSHAHTCLTFLGPAKQGKARPQGQTKPSPPA